MWLSMIRFQQGRGLDAVICFSDVCLQGWHENAWCRPVHTPKARLMNDMYKKADKGRPVTGAI